MDNIDVLDNWDMILIDICKSRRKIDDLKKVWANRCGMSVEYVDVDYPVLRLLDVCVFCGFKPRNLIIEMSPANNYKWVDGFDDGDNYWVVLYRILRSYISCKMAKDIPLYVEWVENNTTSPYKWDDRTGRWLLRATGEELD